MINDRGNKKWTSIMLPEHIEALKKVFAEEDNVEKPILDEQQKMKNELMLQEAIHNNLAVEIKYFNDHDFHTKRGHVTFIGALGGVIKMDDRKIKVEDVLEVNAF